MSGIDPSVLQEVFEAQRGHFEGKLADYIPELGKADRSLWGAAVTSVRGETLELGDARAPFTVQSISKPFAYGLALETHGHELVHQHVGVEPTGEAFNSIIELEKESHRPYNPMINSGAIAVASLIEGANGAEKLRGLQELFSRYTGHPARVDTSVYLSERATGHRNRAIAYLLKHFGRLEGGGAEDVEGALDLYFQQCSILVDARDLSLMAATLANGGVQPVTGERVLSADNARRVLSLMFSCGMYNSAGEWTYTVGLPAKSGVSGGILAVVPGRMGIAAFSPALDRCGHSVRASRFFQELSRRLGLSVFQP